MSNDNPARQLRLSQIYGYVRDGTITVVALTLLVIESLGEPDTEVLLAIMALLGAAPVLRAGSTVRKILNNLESGR